MSSDELKKSVAKRLLVLQRSINLIQFIRLQIRHFISASLWEIYCNILPILVDSSFRIRTKEGLARRFIALQPIHMYIRHFSYIKPVWPQPMERRPARTETPPRYHAKEEVKTPAMVERYVFAVTVRMESHQCKERTGNDDTPLSAIARLQRDCKVSRKRERSNRRAEMSPFIREVVSNRMND